MATEHPTVFAIKKIKLPEEPRRDMGDLGELAESMKTLGQLQEIVLDADCQLVAGERRLRAAILLGWTHIRARVADNLNNAAMVLSAEYDENTQRKQLSVTEACEQGKRVEELLKPIAEAAKKASQAKFGNDGKKPQTGSGGPPSPANSQENAKAKTTGEVAEAAAKAADMGRHRYVMAREIQECAKENPELFGDLVDQMNETENVEGTHKELRKRQAKVADSVGAKGDEMTDHLGKPVPAHLRDHFGDKTFGEYAKAMDDVMNLFLKIKNGVKGKSDSFKWLLAGDVLKCLAEASDICSTVRGHLLAGRPYAVCPVCGGSGKASECKGKEGCRGSGYLPEWRLAELKKSGVIK